MPLEALFTLGCMWRVQAMAFGAAAAGPAPLKLHLEQRQRNLEATILLWTIEKCDDGRRPYPQHTVPPPSLRDSIMCGGIGRSMCLGHMPKHPPPGMP